MTEFDGLDREIVDILQRDGRLPYTEIADRVGCSETTVRRRIARMTEEDSVRIVAVANPFKLGVNIIAIIGLQVDHRRLNDVERVLSDVPEVRFLGVTLGGFDIIFEAWFQTSDDLLDFMSGTLGEIEGIRSSESYQIVRLSKYCYDWGTQPSARLAFFRDQAAVQG